MTKTPLERLLHAVSMFLSMFLALVPVSGNSTGMEKTIVPISQLLPDNHDSGGLADLYAFDPNEALVDNLHEVEAFLDYLQNSHASIILPSGADDEAENPKKLILEGGNLELGGIDSERLRTVSFLEIRVKNLAEAHNVLRQNGLMSNLPNLRFIFLRLPAGTDTEAVGQMLSSSSIDDYRLFFSIDSSV